MLVNTFITITLQNPKYYARKYYACYNVVMPNATIWIRVDNVDAWEAIPNKSEWLNEMLIKETTPLKDMPRISKPVTEVLKDVERKVVNVPATSFCEHGQLKGQCLWKGCKYAR